jgi:branched-chain amino acid transport system ATP-binding protein
MLEVTDLRVGYGHLEVVHGVSLSVADGEFVAVLGSNGAGKSTLLRACSGQMPVRGGSARFDGTDLSRMAPHKIVSLGIGSAMEGRRIFRRQSVLANLELGSYRLGNRKTEFPKVLRRMYELFPVLERKAKLPASTLSGGELQMLAIGQALMSAPRLLVLDEPSAGLAPRLIEDVFTALSRLRDEGLALLLAEQTVEQALTMCDRAYVLEAGSVRLSGTARSLRTNEAIREVYIGSLGHGAKAAAPPGSTSMPTVATSSAPAIDAGKGPTDEHSSEPDKS